MLVFEIYKNTELKTKSGKPDLCVMSANVSAIGVLGSESQGSAAERKEIKLSFDVGGIISDRGSHPLGSLSWYKSKLKVGDEITIKICERDKADEPQFPSEEEIKKIIESQEKAEYLEFERAKNTYFRLKNKFEISR